MKKLTKLMAILMALCLITSSFVGSTLAKYVTSADANDSARVAKFGVTVTAASDAFSKRYVSDVGVDDATTTNVEVASDVKVVAPGTEGTLGTSTVTGTPEVAVEVKREATLELGDNWKDEAGNYYCPLTITVGGTPYYGLDYASADEFEAAVLADAKLVKTTEYAPLTNLATADDVSVTWAWAFEGTDDKQTDEKDTDLGDAAAASTGEATDITIAFSLKTTVTQLDTYTGELN